MNVAPTTKVTGIPLDLTFVQGGHRYILVEAVDKNKETTNIRVSLDGLEMVNAKSMGIVVLNTETLGGHVIRINLIDKRGLAGKEQTFTYAVRARWKSSQRYSSSFHM